MSERVPDVSEQRAEAVAGAQSRRIYAAATALKSWVGPSIEAATVAVKMAIAALEAADRAADPASVLAVLLAESPDATVAALEALLTSDEATKSAVEDWRTYGNGMPRPDLVRSALSAACRSLLPKAPKEAGDA